MHTNAVRADGVCSEFPKWKATYENLVFNDDGPKLKHRAVLHSLLRFSDKYGRVWRGLPSLADHMQCSERHLRRDLAALESEGWIQKMPTTWHHLCVEQADLKLPLPMRSDCGTAPDVITLCYKGAKGCDLPLAPRRRLAVVREAVNELEDKGGQNVEGPPRTRLTVRAPDKMSADQGIYSSIPENDQEGRGSGPEQTPTTVQIVHDGSKEGWDALLVAYNRHYLRVYQARPTREPDVSLLRVLGGHLADKAKVLCARLAVRNVTLSESDAREMLAEQTMKAWLDHPGANGFLRRTAHDLKRLVDDLPNFCQKALEKLIENLSPKPEPRRVADVVPFSQAKPVTPQTNQKNENTDTSAIGGSSNTATSVTRQTKNEQNRSAGSLTADAGNTVQSVSRQTKSEQPELTDAGKKLAAELGEGDFDPVVLNGLAGMTDTNAGSAELVGVIAAAYRSSVKNLRRTQPSIRPGRGLCAS